MATIVRCIIQGEGDQWEGICLDLDIAVHGASFGEVEATLAQSVRSYVEDAMKEAPAQRDRLLSRRVPWHVRLRLSAALALHMLSTGKRQGDGKMLSGFDLACPALICTYREFIAILEQHGFVCIRRDGGSHQRWRAERDGAVRLVDVTPHRLHDEIRTGTLKSMIRQSGLDEKLFRR